jgi:hypothetical protein
MNIAVAALAFGAGAVGWTLTEYGIHRFLGHRSPRAAAKSRLGALGGGDFGTEHMAHHADDRYFTPTVKKVAFATPVIAAMGAGGAAVVGRSVGFGFAAGFGAMYTAYEVVHRRVHTHAPVGAYGRWTHRHHLYHHYGDSKSNHGVTVPWWDRAFGTWADPGVVPIPPRKAPPWMVEPDSGTLRPQYAADYALAQKRSAPLS